MTGVELHFALEIPKIFILRNIEGCINNYTKISDAEKILDQFFFIISYFLCGKQTLIFEFYHDKSVGV